MLLVNPRPNLLTAFLEYIDLSVSIKKIGMGYPALYDSAFLYFVLNIATVDM